MSPLHDDDLSMRERQIMDAVYRLGSASVRDVTDAIPDPPTSNAVRTMLGNLEKKGLLRATRSGRRQLYAPRKSRGRAGRLALRRVLDVFFGGSFVDAMACHLNSARLSEDEARELESMIRKARSKP